MSQYVTFSSRKWQKETNLQTSSPRKRKIFTLKLLSIPTTLPHWTFFVDYWESTETNVTYKTSCMLFIPQLWMPCSWLGPGTSGTPSPPPVPSCPCPHSALEASSPSGRTRRPTASLQISTLTTASHLMWMKLSELILNLGQVPSKICNTLTIESAWSISRCTQVLLKRTRVSPPAATGLRFPSG